VRDGAWGGSKAPSLPLSPSTGYYDRLRMRIGKRIWFSVSATFLFLAVVSLPASGTEEYAKQTGKSCGACHLNPSGGGELTTDGSAFRKKMEGGEKVFPRTGGKGAVRFVAGFLHLFTAVFWFGTILYVHLLLKPAYAAKGLPRGELMVGWGSIIMIALTGGILTAYRVPSIDVLLRTRFGVLLMIKVALYLVMVTTAVIVTFVVGPRLKQRRQVVDQGKKDLMPDELSQFDGKEGRPAYFAYGGNIYDATGSKMWKGGNHVGKHHAGFDLTDALKLAPHGEEKIVSLPLAGRLIETGALRERPLHEKGFYFMAYLNLFLVLGILLVISLWRWW
jgi:predicted heme/steroid binding protein